MLKKLLSKFGSSGWRTALVACALVAGPSFASTSAAEPKTVSVELRPGVRMEFVLIAPGSFIMGSDPNFSDGDETPPHRVTLTRAFYFATCEVTQEQWTAVMAGNPSKFLGPTLPVDNVSWNDAQKFLRSASGPNGRKLRLPTEAEWEYACRAGTTTRWYFGENENELPAHAWCTENAGASTHPVATRPANRWGLHDLYGNVWEWCADRYAGHYTGGDAVDPVGARSGESRVLRGGAWGDGPEQSRSAYRNSMGPTDHNAGTGFRCVLEIDPAHSSP